MKATILLLSAFSVLLFSCSKDDKPAASPRLIFKYKFDASQERLNNKGKPATIAAGNAAQSPVMRGLSAHYIELTPLPVTMLGRGTVLYKNQETTAGGSAAIDFSKAVIGTDNSVFFEMPLKDVKPGKYQYLRVSLSYQSYDIQINIAALKREVTGTLASFIGYKNYIDHYKIKDSTITVKGNRPQGYWGLEVAGKVITGQAPAGATTVPNPLAATSPVPAGSCVVTGTLGNSFEITGNETNDVVITVSLSVNHSFEWKDKNKNGKFDPIEGEKVVDMGIRGLKTIIQK
ncbi:hypothetical protein [Chitinophaga sp. RAB17]|uniref:hypothetical protein n=1 Tax=Chitinophaga sp. RAB17 TaxID=3233049 RepID=UPI003F921F68